VADIATLGIRVTSTGTQQATRELKALEKEADKAEKTAVRLGKAWGLALGAGAATVIVGGVKKIVDNTIEAERVQAKLEARVKALGATSAASVKQIDTLSDKLQTLSTFDDEGIKEAATALLSFTNIRGDNFERTLQTVLDLSEATGTDLTQSAEKLGRALNSPATAARQLRDLGIELSKQQKELVKDLLATGRGSEAQALLLDQLERRYKGSAEAARNTLGGALRGLKNDFDNLLEGDGKGISGVTESINDLAATLRSPEVKQGFAAIVDGLFATAKAAADAIAGVASFSKELKELSGFSLTGAAGLLLNVATGNAQGVVKALARRGLADFSGVTGSVDSTAAVSGAGNPNDRFSGIGFEGGGSGKGRAKRKRELPEFSKDAAEDLKRLIEQEQRATDAYRDMAAVLDGPLAEAQREHEKRVQEINELARQSAEAAEGRDALLVKEADRYAKETAEIERQLNPFGELIEQRQFELSLIGKTPAQIQTAIDLRELEGKVTEEQAAQLAALNEQQERAQVNARYFEDIKFALSDTFTDFITGAKSAKDAFGDFADYIFAESVRVLADRAVQALLGGGGQGVGWLGSLFSGGAGSSAGGLADLFSSASSGFGFADGGWTGPGGRNQVKGLVHADEVVWSQADVARAGGVGNVESMRKGGGRAPITINVPVYGRADTRTRDQIASTSARAIRRASRLVG